MQCEVLWRPEALACSGLTRNPPSLAFKPRTSCISEPTLEPTELLVQLVAFQRCNVVLLFLFNTCGIRTPAEILVGRQ